MGDVLFVLALLVIAAVAVRVWMFFAPEMDEEAYGDASLMGRDDMMMEKRHDRDRGA